MTVYMNKSIIGKLIGVHLISGIVVAFSNTYFLSRMQIQQFSVGKR